MRSSSSTIWSTDRSAADDDEAVHPHMPTSAIARGTSAQVRMTWTFLKVGTRLSVRFRGRL